MHQVYVKDRMVNLTIVRKPIRHSYLRVTNHDEITVKTSNKTTVPQLIEFVKKHEEKLSNLLSQTNRRQAVSSTETLFFGTTIPIVVQKGKSNRCQLVETTLFLTMKEEADQIKIVEKFLKESLQQVALERLNHYRKLVEPVIDLTDLTIKIQKMKSQLGSCHLQKKVIKLSYSLVFLDVEYLDAILLHELAHLRFGGHQADFYRLLTSWCPNYKELRKQIRSILLEIEV